MTKENAEKDYVYSLIDEPSAFNSIEEWNEHYAFLKSLPDNHWHKQEMLKDAEETMAWKRKHQMH